MKMKSLLAATAVSATFFSPIAAHADDNVLDGDAGLACEAILCLSSAERPNECAKSLRRYFSIKLKKPHKTIQARKNFLNLCPSSTEPNMPQLIDALANGAGRCDAASLNRIGYYVGSREERRFVLSTTKPSYCTALENHPWANTPKTKLVPIYCTRTIGRDSVWQQQKTEKYQCGQKWVDIN